MTRLDHIQSNAHRKADDLVLSCVVPLSNAAPLDAVYIAFAGHDLAQVFLFMSPGPDFDALNARAAELFDDCCVASCTTAGEIGPKGYTEGHIMAVGLPRDSFATKSVPIPDLNELSAQDLCDEMVQTRLSLAQANPDKPNGFAFLLVDGLSMKEDELASIITPALGPLPLFGGSAGDGDRFERTQVACAGETFETGAVVTFVYTDCETRVFSLNHLVPTDQRMVVTEADPENRVVKSINAEPAAREYARIVGKDPNQLDEFTFAAHPVVVRFGDTHHVRAIQRVNERGELVFFSAIDEGMVLTVADAQGIASHLDAELEALSRDTAPATILGCDCILRRIEAEQTQATRAVSDVLARHHVVGFSTYGEQIGPMHVNHTMTGVALYPPKARPV